MKLRGVEDEAKSNRPLVPDAINWTRIGKEHVMKTYLNTIAAAAVALAAAAPAFANDQLAASAGISPAEAAGLSLTEIAQAKFNRETGGDDRHEIVTPGVASAASLASFAKAAGLSPAEAQGMSLTEIAAVKFNRETRGQDAQRVERGNVTMAARSVPADNAGWAQLIASAGLSPADAAGMSLAEIAAVKFASESDDN
jgi:hypothetical protein